MYKAKFIFVVFLIAFLAIIAISITLSGGVDKFIENVRLALVQGRFEIKAQPPTVEAIYLEHPISGLANCTENYLDCSTDPDEGYIRYPTIIAMVRDTSGDCDTQDSAYVTVCTPGMVECNNVTYDRAAKLNFLAKSSDNAYCNFSTNVIGFDYYETPGDWGIYANATDGARWNSNEPYSVRFYYTPKPAFSYPASGSLVDMGVLRVGEWNNGTGDAGTPPTNPAAQNIGNVKQNVTWNASDFTTGIYTFQIDGTNYVIDDDKDGTSDVDNFEEVYIDNDPTKEVMFPYNASVVPPVDGYLDVCSNFDCDGVNDQDAKFNIYWHINIPIGQEPGTYSNDISITNVG